MIRDINREGGGQNERFSDDGREFLVLPQVLGETERGACSYTQIYEKFHLRDSQHTSRLIIKDYVLFNTSSRLVKTHSGAFKIHTNSVKTHSAALGIH